MQTEKPQADLTTQVALDEAAVPGYGRARLVLGMSAVGTWVLIASGGLALGGPQWFAQAWSGRIGGAGGEALALGMFLVTYALVQLPFDVLGGYALQRSYGRAAPSLGAFLMGLSRGVVVQGALLFGVAGALTVAGHYGGGLLLFVAAVAASLVLLALRTGVARMLAASDPSDAPPSLLAGAGMPTRFVHAVDEGFTGGVAGVIRPQVSILPAAWGPALGDAGLRLAISRRSAAVATGAWRRGRVLALGFTWVGFALAALAVALCESAAMGTAAGTVAFSLWFTLWSFLGLLVLPTFSRRGVAEVDARLLAQGTTPDELSAVTRTLDQLQDGELSRPGWVEVVFHPIPSVNNRRAAAGAHPPRGAWDAARTTVFVSAAGLGLLGRAVHCNCGRPGLWAFLPTE